MKWLLLFLFDQSRWRRISTFQLIGFTALAIITLLAEMWVAFNVPEPWSLLLILIMGMIPSYCIARLVFPGYRQYFDRNMAKSHRWVGLGQYMMYCAECESVALLNHPYDYRPANILSLIGVWECDHNKEARRANHKERMEK